jgi:hypothetical protein
MSLNANAASEPAAWMGKSGCARRSDQLAAAVQEKGEAP